MLKICKMTLLVCILSAGCFNKNTLHLTTQARPEISSRTAVEQERTRDTFSLPSITKDYYIHAKELLQKYRFDSLNTIDFTKMRFSFLRYCDDKLAQSNTSYTADLHGCPITPDQRKLVTDLNKEMGKKNYAKARVLADKILDINYVDLEIQVIKAQIDFELNTQDTFHSVIGDKLMESIQSINDGESASTPFHMISGGEIDAMMFALNFPVLKTENPDGNLFKVTFIDNKKDTVHEFFEVSGYVALKSAKSDRKSGIRPASEIDRPYYVRSADKINEMIIKSGGHFIRSDSLNPLLYKAFYTGTGNDTLKAYFQVLRYPKKLPTLADCRKIDSTYYACSVDDFEGIIEASGFKFIQSENMNNCFQKIIYLNNKNDTVHAYFKLTTNSDSTDDDCGDTVKN